MLDMRIKELSLRDTQKFALVLPLVRIKNPIDFLPGRSPLLETFTDEEIRDRYRFRRDSIEYLCELLEDQLVRPTNRSHALSVSTQVLIGLRYLASGSFQQVIGDILGVDKSTVSRVLIQFLDALISKKDQFIKFPRNIAEKNILKQGFYEIAGFPSVIGCIDCTHVRIKTPNENEMDYVNRKSFHSINVQAITDHHCCFINVEARWPGSTHDSFIFRNSAVKQHLDENNVTIEQGLILGDSG